MDKYLTFSNILSIAAFIISLLSLFLNFKSFSFSKKTKLDEQKVTFRTEIINTIDKLKNINELSFETKDKFLHESKFTEEILKNILKENYNKYIDLTVELDEALNLVLYKGDSSKILKIRDALNEFSIKI